MYFKGHQQKIKKFKEPREFKFKCNQNVGISKKNATEFIYRITQFTEFIKLKEVKNWNNSKNSKEAKKL